MFDQHHEWSHSKDYIKSTIWLTTMVTLRVMVGLFVCFEFCEYDMHCIDKWPVWIPAIFTDVTLDASLIWIWTSWVFCCYSGSHQYKKQFSFCWQQLSTCHASDLTNPSSVFTLVWPSTAHGCGKLWQFLGYSHVGQSCTPLRRSYCKHFNHCVSGSVWLHCLPKFL